MVKKTYITPAFLAVELGMKSVAMLSASDDTQQILGNGGDGNGEDIGIKGVTDINIWDDEW